MPEHAGFADHGVEADIVWLRVNRVDTGQFEANADAQRRWVECSQRAIEEASTITNPVSGGIKRIDRKQQGFGHLKCTFTRRWNTVSVCNQRGAGNPFAKSQCRPDSEDNREQCREPGLAGCDPRHHQRSQIGFILYRPAETDAHSRQLRKVIFQMLTDSRRKNRANVCR